MKQEHKDLLLKDLCARLSYGVKVLCLRDFNHDWYNLKMVDIEDNEVYLTTYEPHANRYVEIEAVKPYLFPLSSITAEQEKELAKLGVSYGEYALHDDIRGLGIMVDEAYIFFEFCYKNHIDFLD